MISVIVPVYNSAKTIRRLAKSLMAQTDDDYEVLFIDDGSTDETARILKDICADWKNYRVVTTKNGGAAAARNVGMEKARGEVICFADSDDIVSPNYVKKMRETMNETKADVVCAKYARNKKADFELLSEKTEVLNGKEAVNALLKMEIDNGPVAKLFTKKAIGEYRMPNVAVAEDLAFNYLVLKGAKKVAVNDSVLYSYIETNGSLSTKQFSTERMGSLAAVQEIDRQEKSFYSKARVFMEAYFICEQIVLAKGTEKYVSEYEQVCAILKKERKAILGNKNATRRQKLIARLLKFGPKITVRIMTAKRIVRKK